jgi:hypothetical protein
MRLLRLADVETLPSDRIFYHSRVRASFLTGCIRRAFPKKVRQK